MCCKRKVVNFKNTIKHFSSANKGTNFAEEKKCEDYHWGIYVSGNAVQISPRNEGKKFDVVSLKKKNVIIILAESPHVFEYYFQNGVCSGFKSPLHRCDNRIKKHLNANKNNWIDSKIEYDVVIVNAIQYQCSFGLKLWKNQKNQDQRNKVFEWTWTNENALADLQKRLSTICLNKNEVILFNCCTAYLKKFCNAANIGVPKGCQNFLLFDEKHPSVWR